jgi:hypothetical protein
MDGCLADRLHLQGSNDKEGDTLDKYSVGHKKHIGGRALAKVARHSPPDELQALIEDHEN